MFGQTFKTIDHRSNIISDCVHYFIDAKSIPYGLCVYVSDRMSIKVWMDEQVTLEYSTMGKLVQTICHYHAIINNPIELTLEVHHSPKPTLIYPDGLDRIDIHVGMGNEVRVGLRQLIRTILLDDQWPTESILNL